MSVVDSVILRVNYLHDAFQNLLQLFQILYERLESAAYAETRKADWSNMT